MIARAVGVPVLAIGGVTLERMDEVARSGAAGIAAIGLFIASPSGPSSSGVAELRDAAPLEAIVDAARRRFDTSATRS
jgi:thiamine monophosphate synthase